MGRFCQAFRFAARGIGLALRKERNVRFHCCVGAYVLWFSRFYQFGPVEYALLALCIGGVLALELVNSALERAVEAPEPTRWLAAGEVKDMAAGAVLVFALAAAAVGGCLFWQPEVLRAVLRYFAGHFWRLAVLLGSVLAAAWFVFGYGQRKG